LLCYNQDIRRIERKKRMLLLVNLLNSFDFASDLFKKKVSRKHFALFSVAMISKTKNQYDHIGLQLI